MLCSEASQRLGCWEFKVRGSALRLKKHRLRGSGSICGLGCSVCFGSADFPKDRLPQENDKNTSLKPSQARGLNPTRSIP